MPNEDGEYTAAEVNAYKPDPCPECGGRQRVQRWFHINPNDPGEPRYLPGLTECTNEACPRNNR